MGIFNKKPIPYEIYPIEQAMKFIKKYGDSYDFPAHGDGHMAIPKEKIGMNTKPIQERVGQNKKQKFKNTLSREGKLKEINITNTSSQQETTQCKEKKYGDYQNTKGYKKSIDITR